MLNDENTCSLHAANACHAAATWLERIEADADAVAVVQIAPRTTIGIWQQGRESVGVMTPLDDAGIEVLEAVAPIAQLGFEAMTEAQRVAAADAIQSGAKLQILVMPAAGEIALRLVHGQSAVVLGAVAVERRVH